MEHTGSQSSKIQHFIISDLTELSGSRNNTGIGSENAVHIGIDLAGIRMKGCCQRYSCGIGAAAAQCRVILIAVHTLETGYNDDLAAGQLMKDSLFINLL